MKKNFSEHEIIAAIQAGGRGLEEVMRFIYERGEFREGVFKFVFAKSGTKEDAEDIFQDGIAHLIMNIRKGNFRGDSSIKTYLTVICKKLWFRKFNRATKLEAIKEKIDRTEEHISSPEKILLYKEREILLKNILIKIGSPCKEILSMWGLNYSMKEIAEATGYKNEGVMRKKKHQCMKQLVKWAKKEKDLHS